MTQSDVEDLILMELESGPKASCEIWGCVTGDRDKLATARYWDRALKHLKSIGAIKYNNGLHMWERVEL